MLSEEPASGIAQHASRLQCYSSAANLRLYRQYALNAPYKRETMSIRSPKFWLILMLFALASSACSAPAADPTPAPVINTPVPPTVAATAEPAPTVAATATPLPAPTEVETFDTSNFVRIENAVAGHAISAPADWYTEIEDSYTGLAPNETVLNTGAGGGSAIFISSGARQDMQTAFELEDGSLQAITNAFINSVLVDTGRVISGPTETTRNGLAALETVAQLDSAEETGTVRIIAIENETQLAILTVASTDTAVETDTPLLNAMLETVVLMAPTEPQAAADPMQTWVMHTDAAETFTVTLPEAWANLSMDGANVSDVLQSFDGSQNVAAILSGDMLRGLAISGVKFFAVDTTPAHNIASIPPSINVTVVTTGAGLEVDALLETTRKQLEGIVTPNTEIQTDIVLINDVPTAHLVYEMNLTDLQGGVNNRYIEAYLWQVGEKSYNLTLNVPTELKDVYLEDFMQIADQFVVNAD